MADNSTDPENSRECEKLSRYFPYSHQFIDKEDINAVSTTLRSDFITQGPHIEMFERALCGYTGSRYAVAVSSGTAALHLACLAAGVKKRDSVITSPITFVASANCILYCQAAPAFADIESSTGCMDPVEFGKNIRKNTKAVIPVHYSGHPCRMKDIYDIARRHKIMIIEDAAHALGSKYYGSKIGSCRYSDMTILSFHPVKAITTGEGGAILTNRRELYDKLLILRNHGITKDASKWKNRNMESSLWYYEQQELGFNYRITDIQASLGVSQLKKLDHFIEKRRSLARLYDAAFEGNEYFDLPIEEEYAHSSYHLYHIRLKDGFVKKKALIFQALRDKGVGVQVHYMPVYLQPYFKKLGFKTGRCPKSEIFYQKEMSIPLYPGLKKNELFFLADTILETIKNIG